MSAVLAVAATAYGMGAAASSLLQARRMRQRQDSADVSLGFLSSYIGGYAMWLAYGLSIGSMPLIVVDAIGLVCGGATLLVAIRLRAPRTTARRVASTRAGDLAVAIDRSRRNALDECYAGQSRSPARDLLRLRRRDGGSAAGFPPRARQLHLRRPSA